MGEPEQRSCCHAERWRGLLCWRVTLAQGDSLLVAEQGAQVLSWRAHGREQLFLSPGSAADGHTPIRGNGECGGRHFAHGATQIDATSFQGHQARFRIDLQIGAADDVAVLQ